MRNTPTPESCNEGNFPADQLLTLVYEELKAMAAVRMANESADHTLQPTALVHEAWLRLRESRNPWQTQAQFFRAAAVAMRRILIECARQKTTLKRSGSKMLFDIADLDPAVATPDEHLLLVEESLQQLEREDPESAEIVMLKFFSGLTNKETATTLSISEATVERRWVFAKACLFRIIRDLVEGGGKSAKA
ncbi:MAG TPA: ECF-type sigma factor [Luteolibacter sp.]